jgi:hypothetical protein
MKAFPWSIDNGESVRGEKGMDLRDYFAAKAMQGYMSRKLIDGFDEDVVAEMSYKVADAMIKERDRVKEQA